MATVTVINPITGTGTGNFDAAAYAGVTFFATGLDAAEEVEVLIGGGPVAVAACREDGTPIVLTGGSPSAHVQGGPHYVLQKGVSVGAAGVYAAPRID